MAFIGADAAGRDVYSCSSPLRQILAGAGEMVPSRADELLVVRADGACPVVRPRMGSRYVSIVDVLGRERLRTDVVPGQRNVAIDLSDLAPGSYLVSDGGRGVFVGTVR